MSLLGEGALVIWHDIAAGHESDYEEWRAKEHLLERVGVAGFRRGHGGRAISGSPQYVNWYEVEELATLTSKPYLDRLNDPTPWSQRALGNFRNTNRTLCRVITSVGNGISGHLLTLQLIAAPGRGDGLGAWLSATMPALVERPGVVGAHYLEGDVAASRIETDEKRLRAGGDAVADRVVLVGGYEVEALEELRRSVLSPAALLAQGAAEPQAAAVYRLLHCIIEADLASRDR